MVGERRAEVLDRPSQGCEIDAVERLRGRAPLAAHDVEHEEVEPPFLLTPGGNGDLRHAPEKPTADREVRAFLEPREVCASRQVPDHPRRLPGEVRGDARPQDHQRIVPHREGESVVPGVVVDLEEQPVLARDQGKLGPVLIEAGPPGHVPGQELLPVQPQLHPVVAAEAADHRDGLLRGDRPVEIRVGVVAQGQRVHHAVTPLGVLRPPRLALLRHRREVDPLLGEALLGEVLRGQGSGGPPGAELERFLRPRGSVSRTGSDHRLRPEVLPHVERVVVPREARRGEDRDQ